MASGLTSIASRHPSIRVLQIVLKLTLRVLAPDVFLRQLTALTALIIVRHALWRLRRWIRSLTRQIPFLGGPKGRLREELRLARRKCKDYASFQHIGEKLDRLEGKDRWKRDDNSSLFDSDRLRERTKRYREMMESNDVYACMYALRGELLRKHFGICNPALFQVTNTGTKVMIEKYVETICEAMAWVGFSYNAPSVRTDEEAKKEAIRERLAFFNETKHGFGRSALLLSGGASVGMYHFGVVKALHLNGLLPRVMSGTSAGSIVCGMLGVRTDEELTEMWQEDFSWSDNFSLEFFGGKDLQRFSRTGEELYSSEHLGKVLRDNIGDYTFLEAFDRTGRIINITVSGLPGNTRYPMLLNYLTSPHVLVWSAAQCSAAVPGIFRSRELLVKDRHGNIGPYVSGGLKWQDGSMQSDLPMARLSELFNVNYFIVSQVNPQAMLLTGGGVGSQRGPIYRMSQFLRREIKQYLLSMMEFWKGASARHPWLRPVGNTLIGLMVQEYEGDVTIYNGRGLLEMPSLLENPTEDTLRRYTIASEWETWWHIPEIQNACAIEFVMDEICKELLADLRASEDEKSGLQRTPSLISRMMPPATGLNRLPSFHQEALRKEQMSSSQKGSVKGPKKLNLPASQGLHRRGSGSTLSSNRSIADMLLTSVS